MRFRHANHLFYNAFTSGWCTSWSFSSSSGTSLIPPNCRTEAPIVRTPTAVCGAPTPEIDLCRTGDGAVRALRGCSRAAVWQKRFTARGGAEGGADEQKQPSALTDRVEGGGEGGAVAELGFQRKWSGREDACPQRADGVCPSAG